jgi:glutathione S-transferase
MPALFITEGVPIMTLKIYGSHDSRARRTFWIAHELGIPYEHIQLHHTSEDRHAPDYLRLNPNGTVPCIDDDGTVLFESLAINLYLAKKYADRGLWAEALNEQGEIFQWTLWAATEAEPHARVWYHHTTFLPAPQRKPELAEAALRAVHKRFRVLDGVLAARTYLVGERFTVADLNLAAVLQRFKEMGGDDYEHARGWYQRCMVRPAATIAFAPTPPAA